MFGRGQEMSYLSTIKSILSTRIIDVLNFLKKYFF